MEIASLGQTSMGEAALAHVADLVPSFLAGLAGRRNDLHKRGLVIFVGYIAGFHASGQMHRLILRAQRQSHGKPETLAHDRAGTVDAFSISGSLHLPSYMEWLPYRHSACQRWL